MLLLFFKMVPMRRCDMGTPAADNDVFLREVIFHI